MRVLLHRGEAPKLHYKHRSLLGHHLSQQASAKSGTVAGKMLNASYLVRLPQSKAEADEVAIVRRQVVEDVASLR